MFKLIRESFDMHHRVAAALLTLGAALTVTPAAANAESDAAQRPHFISLERVDAQPLSQEEMQRIAGLGSNSQQTQIDPNILARLRAGLGAVLTEQVSLNLRQLTERGLVPPTAVNTLQKTGWDIKK